jgi:lysophospholipase L1-like esterase
MIFEDGDTIVFTGDSTTDAGRKRPYGEGLWEGVGNGYVRNVDSILSVLYPEKKFRIINTGVSGAQSINLLDAWQHDVIDLNPDWVFFMIGANDVWRQFDTPCGYNSDKSPEAYEKNVEEIILKTIGKVKGIYVMSPFYMEANDNDAMKKMMVEYSKIAKKVANKYEKDNVKFIDLQPDFDEHLKYRYPAYISWDRVHPNWIGSVIIARKILKEIGAKPLY